MGVPLILKPQTSTPLYVLKTHSLEIYLALPPDVPVSEAEKLLVLNGLRCQSVSTLRLPNSDRVGFRTVTNLPFMIMNGTAVTVGIEYSENPALFEKIYDPEGIPVGERTEIDAIDFLNVHRAPYTYLMHRTTWYSVELIYDTFRYLYIRPGTQIGLIANLKTPKLWEILEGRPIVIVGNKVDCNTRLRQKFAISVGQVHGIIVPADSEWVLVKVSFEDNVEADENLLYFIPYPE